MATSALSGVPLYQPRPQQDLNSLIQGLQAGQTLAAIPQQQRQAAAAQQLNELITAAKLQELQQGKLMEVGGSVIRINPQTGQSEVVFQGNKSSTPESLQFVGFQNGVPLLLKPRSGEFVAGQLPGGATAPTGLTPKTQPVTAPESQQFVGFQNGVPLQFGNKGGGITPAKVQEGLSVNAPLLPTTQKPLRKGMMVADANGVVSFTVLDEGEKIPEGSRSFNPPSATDESGFRKEFLADPIVKDFVEIAPQYQRIQAAMDEAKTSNNYTAVDQTLINTFNKMLDPKSVVRESEYARTAQDQGVLDYLKGKFDPSSGKLIIGGAGLSPESRDAMKRMADRFYDAAQNNYLQSSGYYSGIAKQRGFNFGLPPIPGVDSLTNAPIGSAPATAPAQGGSALDRFKSKHSLK